MKFTSRLWLFIMLFLCLYGVFPAQSHAEVNVNIGVFAPPPPLVMAGPPLMSVIPGTSYIYFVPDSSLDVFFYGGHWYRPYGGHWFKARSYRGPWNYINHGNMPHVLGKLPHGYRNISPGYQRIPYGQVRKNWRQWDKEHYWDDRRGGRNTCGRAYSRSEFDRRSIEHHGRGNERH